MWCGNAFGRVCLRIFLKHFWYADTTSESLGQVRISGHWVKVTEAKKHICLQMT